jgi:phosphoribosylformimino-5-aminoimidazole carboxamide ribotide isomerase
MTVAIIDYGSGNLHSAAKAFERASRGMVEPQKVMVTRDPDTVYRADRIVLPGVGAFADCRRGLDAVDGMLEAMTEAVRVKARPFFGICVGMQLMATRGKEHVTTNGFNWIEGDVEKISPREENLKIPHMGWNTLDPIREHPVLERLPLGPKGRHAYFVSPQRVERSGRAGTRRLRRAGDRDRRQGHRHRHAVSPREEPAFWSGPDLELFEVEAVILFPAVDLKNGQCVRLEQGDMARATVFNLDPAAQARAFAEQGFEYLHVVDLDGAFAGKPMNARAVEAMLKAVTMPVQLGGGIRDLKTVDAWLDKGIARVIIGTAAVRDPELVKSAAKKFPGRVAVGLDARDGKVAVEGWAETSQVTALEIAQRFEDAGVAAIIFTDIARDGLLKGLNLDATIALAERISIPVIASGGFASIEDVKALLEPRARKLAGAIAGRALYDGRLDPAAALTLIRNARAAAA